MTIRLPLLLAFTLLSCPEVRHPERPRENVRAREIWKAQETAVARAVNGEVHGDDFARACAFFKEVAGIDVHGQGEYLGWMPTRQTGADLKLLQTWYQKNADRLRADERGHVTVVPPQ